MKRIALLATLSMLSILPIGLSYGSSIQVSIAASKPVYKYGDNLSFVVTVSNVTGDTAVLEIMDQSNRSSSPINMIITKPVSNITAPVPFYKTAFAPGNYSLSIQYAGANAVTNFQLVDIGDIAIPTQFKTVASSWVQNQTSTKLFGENMAYLISSGIIEVDGYHTQNVTVIPPWFKNVAQWWSNGLISDNDFGHSIQYLVKSNLMKV